MGKIVNADSAIKYNAVVCTVLLKQMSYPNLDRNIVSH